MTTSDDDPIDDLDDAISLKPYFEILRRYRRVIGAAVVCVGALFMVGVTVSMLILPVERLGSIQFRLLFDGAAEGHYPNLTPFSVSEVVASPVLTQVYALNGLQRYVTFDDFKDSMFVQQSNLELDLLSYEYEAILADTKLNSVDRARIQDEFRKKRAAMVDPSYSISMRRSERLRTLPRELMEKTLRDTLSTWAKQADERKGATRYNVAVLSPGFMRKDLLEREEYLVAIDILRTKAARVLDTIAEIATLPGARTIRLGPERTTLADVSTGLEEVVRFKLEPLLGLIRSEGATKNSRSLALYASNQLFQLRLEQQESTDIVRALQIALREHVNPRGPSSSESNTGPSGSGSGTGGGQAMMPQLDQSFLDRIMTLSTAQADAEYRRKLTDRLIAESVIMAARNREAAYYEDLVKALGAGIRKSGGSSEIVALIRTSSSDAFDAIAKGVEQTAAIYREISALNLNPSTTLYSVSGPFTLQTRWSLTVRTVGLFFVLLMTLTPIIASIGCLVHHASKRRS